MKRLSYILFAVFVYYIIKTILTLRNMKQEYYKSRNDIKEIVKKGSKKEWLEVWQDMEEENMR